MGKAIDKLKDIGTNEVSAYFAGKAVGRNVLARATGKVVNQNLELLFTGPQLRSFNYTYRFTPREEKEAEMIKRIIKFFKSSMAPRRSDQRVFLETPHVYRLKYIYKNGEQHPFLNKIKTCALRNFSIQYTPDGSYMTYDDGSMTSYEVQLTFGEMNPIYANDFENDTNDMGY